ncbi:MAG: glycosyltransferase [Pararhodobacter sp.]
MSAAFHNQISVLIRFSYPAASGFRAAREGVDQARRLLYDPARLARRFRLFETLALPSLLAQSARDFTTIVLIGEDMPATARTRLQALLAPLHGARIVALPPLPMFGATRRAYDAALDPHATHLTSVRLDDDDAISTDLVARLKAMVPGAVALMGAQEPLVISHQNGLFAEIAPSGNRVYGVVERSPLGIGLAMVAPVGRRDTIFSRNHRLLGQFYGCLSDAVIPAFIRTVHRDNDAEPHASGQVFDLSDAQADTLLQTRFATTLDALRALPA